MNTIIYDTYLTIKQVIPSIPNAIVSTGVVGTGQSAYSILGAFAPTIPVYTFCTYNV